MSKFLLHVVTISFLFVGAACGSTAGPVVTAPEVASNTAPADETAEGSTEPTELEGDAVAGDGATVRLQAASYDQEFVIVLCDSGGESDLTIDAMDEAGDQSLTAEVADNEGTIRVEGDEALSGSIINLEVSNSGDFTFSGTFDGPASAGESFSGTGRCI